MLSCVERWRARLFLLAAIGCVTVLSACAARHPCSPEVCDGRDNDCDGKIDEDFVDASGLYATDDHCGGCGIACSQVFPTAAQTVCVVEADAPQCRITGCPEGQVLSGASACIPEPPLLCLPCASDDECAVRSAGARCIADANGGGRCGRVCDPDGACPQGYSCQQVQGGARQCRPSAGSCLCSEAMTGALLACELHADATHVCAGVQECTSTGLGACKPALAETCNGQDDDCDLVVDNGFLDAQGRYVGRDHCGGCGMPCVEPGPHMVAACVPSAHSASCHISCDAGFVDVDGLSATGCECQLATGPVVLVGGDGNCDGIVDPTPRLIFVSPAGNDANDGSDVQRPVRTIPRGLALGHATGRSVLVASGIYAGPVALLPSVALVGGYSPDFRERDLALYPVLIEAPSGADGKPVLICKDITTTTYFDGFSLAAGDATSPGQGSTAVSLDGCGPNVELVNLTVLAARASTGTRGQDSSERLASRGLSSLTQLDAVTGAHGGNGGVDAIGCPPIAGGDGGAKVCGSHNVSGGSGGGALCQKLSCDNASSTRCGNAGCADFTSHGLCDLNAAKLAAVANPAAHDGQGSSPGKGGEPTYDAPTDHGVCEFCDDNPSLPRIGDDGASGMAGSDGGAGSACTGVVSLDPGGRVAADSGEAGADGSDGSGGGGGTAGAGYAVIANTAGTCSSVPGGSGGGGGSGGCGAPGASGGGGGGVSVGVLVRLSTAVTSGPTLRAVRIVTASGGDGGDGGIGASGGGSGAGGLGGESQFWCARSGGRGGDGGPGGAGGGGGGGCGGGSYGVMVVAAGVDGTPYASALAAQAQVEVAGGAGRGGRGGFSPGHAAPAGTDGTTGPVVLATPSG